MSDTHRTVETVFTAKDAGYGAVVGRLSSSFQQGSQHLDRLRHRFGEFRREQGLTTLAALGLGYGIGSWIEKAKEASAEFIGTQKALAGVLAGSLKFPKGTSEIEKYNRAMVLSRGITEQSEELGARFNMRLDDVASSYKTVATAAGGLGASQKQVNALTLDAVATAKAYGVDGPRAATAVARAIQTGSVRGFEPFDIRLRSVLGNMKKLSQVQRFEHVERALRGSVQIADAMSTGIGASLNRAQVTVTAVFREATEPLFKAIGVSLDSWAKHIREVKEQGKPLIDIFANKLVDGFKALQSVSAFLHDHWQGLAIIFGNIKAMELAKSIGGGISGLGGAMGTGGLGATIGTVGGLFGKLATTTLPLIGALAALKIGIDALGDFIVKKLEEGNKEEVKAYGVSAAFGTAKSLSGLGVLDEKQSRIARKTVDEFRRAGVLGPGGFNRGELTHSIGQLSSSQREDLAGKLGIKNPYLPVSQMATTQFADAMIKQIGPLVSAFAQTAPALSDQVNQDQKLKFAKQVQNFYGDWHVTQKFDDADPDRIMVAFERKISREVGSRTQAITAEPQGD